ncbi:BZ3500_MvSof-1268-A1-R1_Chr1-3g01752 [Microbotryum saponariae]|uniref:BZ3500_MvSof-1268-A1-R1_Chr1-3g01752 protein n=1 Tax=Microbotryum saponariae TaxID=289078 RepID=A0A2X0LEX0_9BASI|nr:BZ3500_MvSof-1268-A1-R1_Chr1-3g01752 [Microbotryum saponariae]SCZ94533.1 BZ3501_MvSof-1269-A2-R1_Chr1-3g01354 [Microbotryum saponariae]
MVAPPTWVPPLSSSAKAEDSTSSSSSSSPSPSTSPSSYLSTVPGELAFFRALIYHRPIGPDRHWEMLSVALKFRNYCRSRVSEGFEEYRDAENVEMRHFWDKYDECYDLAELEKTWEDEQYEEDSNSEANSPPVSTRSDVGAPQEASSRKSSTKPPSAPAWISRRFPPRPFSLLVSYPPPASSLSSTVTPPVSTSSKARGRSKTKEDESLAEIDPMAPESMFNELLVQRKLRKKGDPASPELGPVREFSLTLPDDSDDEEKESGAESDKKEEEDEEEDEEDERPKGRKRAKRESTTTSTRAGAGKSTTKTKATKKAASDDKAAGAGAGADSESDLTDMSDEDDGNEASEANRDDEREDEDEERDEEKTTAASKVSKRSRHTRSSSVATAPEQESVGRRKTQMSVSAKAEPKAKRGAASKKR